MVVTRLRNSGWAGLVLVVSAGCGIEPAAAPPLALVVGPESRPVAELSDGYVGSSKCQECHRREYATWHDSFHRTMTQVASAAAVVGNFDGIELERAGRRYRLGHEQDKFWVEYDAPVAGQEKPPAQRIRQNVVLCTGSHHMQVYWLSTGNGRELIDFPFVWVIADQRWIPRESSFLMSPTASDVATPSLWNSSCIRCHTTYGKSNIEPSQPPQSTVAEFGISCEACHGPGDAHVRYHGQAKRPSDADPIVQPAKLAHQRSSEVCGQCHMAWHYQVAGSALSYRPGDELQKLRKTVVNPAQFWPDGTIRIVGREFNSLTATPCFQRGSMSCLSCHQLHQSEEDVRPRAEWTDDLLQPEMHGNQACVSCHEEFQAPGKLAAHTHHAATSQGSLCYNCHMPNTTYGILKATRAHQITNPSVVETLTAGRPNACNLCHLDQTLKWTDEKLVEWYQQKPTEMPEAASATALSVHLSLAGDAGQRALMAWHMGWGPAREASGEAWLAPYLAILMADNYPAVRYIAHRSLKQLGGYDDIPYDSEMSPDKQRQAADTITSRWQQQRALRERPLLLISPTGELDQERVSRLLEQRNHTAISLEE